MNGLQDRMASAVISASADKPSTLNTTNDFSRGLAAFRDKSPPNFMGG